MKVVRNKYNLQEGKKVWTCDNCGEPFTWNENSSWYGSLKDMEKSRESITVVCSDKCKLLNK